MKKPSKFVLLASFLFLLNSSVFANQTITARLDEIRKLELESPTDAVLTIDHLLTSLDLSTQEKGQVYLERGKVLRDGLNEKDKALIDFYKALWFFRDSDAKEEEIRTLFFLGNTYNALYHHDKAIEYFTEVIAKEPDDPKILLNAEYSIAYSFRMKERFDTALVLQKKLAIEFGKLGMTTHEIYSHLETGLSFIGLNSWADAREHYKIAENLLSKLSIDSRRRHKSKVLGSLGFVSLKEGDYVDAEMLLLEALPLMEEEKDLSMLVKLYNNLGLLELAKNNQNQALRYFNKSISVDPKEAGVLEVKDALLELINIYKGREAMDIALNYSERLNKITIPFIELSKKLERLHDRYKAEKADYEIEKFKLQVALIKAQNRYIIIGIVLIIVLIISIFYYIRFKKQQRIDDDLIENLKLKHQVLDQLSFKLNTDVATLQKLFKSGNL